MRIPLFLVQAVLLILWYTIPSWSAVPLWLILLPTLVPLAIMGGLALFILFCAVSVGLIEIWQERQKRKARGVRS